MPYRRQRIRIGESLRVVLLACLVWGISQAQVRLGVTLGERWISPGEGYVNDTGVVAHLFRFDSGVYYTIARDGYVYNGNPDSEPNIVFGPLFPLCALGWSTLTGMDLVSSGFWVNEILFLVSLALLLHLLRRWLGRGAGFAVLLATATAAGSYSYHAYYSESVTLFCLSLCLWAYYGRHWILLACACALLGGCRLATASLVGVFSVALLIQGVRRRQPGEIERFAALGLLSLAGTLGYLGYIGWKFGNPLRLLPEIQNTSWSAFHRELSWPDLLLGRYLWSYWTMALQRGWESWLDIRTLNLAWLTLAAVGCGYMLLRYRNHLATYLALAYFAFIYASDASSEFLISAHRFFVFFLPIFLVFVSLHRAVASKVGVGAAWVVSAFLLSLNVAYGLWHTASFDRGVWYWF